MKIQQFCFISLNAWLLLDFRASIIWRERAHILGLPMAIVILFTQWQHNTKQNDVIAIQLAHHLNLIDRTRAHTFRLWPFILCCSPYFNRNNQALCLHQDIYLWPSVVVHSCSPDKTHTHMQRRVRTT